MYQPWTKMGEAGDMAVSLGLHQEKRVDDSTPFFLCQLRERLFFSVYSHEKFLAAFLGRPPRISYRHCVVQEPLDLTDEQICMDEPELSEALAALRDGWSVTGPPNRMTWRKVNSARNMIREDILEIALAPLSRNIDSQIE